MERALAAVTEALDAVDAEIARIGIEAASVALPGITTCRRYLERMRELLTSGHLPPVENRHTGLGRQVADSWPQSRLGELVLLADGLFQSAK